MMMKGCLRSCNGAVGLPFPKKVRKGNHCTSVEDSVFLLWAVPKVWLRTWRLGSKGTKLPSAIDKKTNYHEGNMKMYSPPLPAAQLCSWVELHPLTCCSVWFLRQPVKHAYVLPRFVSPPRTQWSELRDTERLKRRVCGERKSVFNKRDSDTYCTDNTRPELWYMILHREYNSTLSCLFTDGTEFM